MTDAMSGKTVRWSYADGPMQGKSFEHVFAKDGTVSWKDPAEKEASADSHAKYELSRINEDIYVFSYLSRHGFTLTTVVDERAGTVVSFASNEKELIIQHGALEGAKWHVA